MANDPRNTRAQYTYDVTVSGGPADLAERLDEIMFGLEFVKSVEPGWKIDQLSQDQLRVVFVSGSVWSSAASAKAVLEKFFGKNTDVHTVLVDSTPLGPKG